jgi:hypothetical protein
MNPEYIAYPWRKDLDPIIEDLRNKLNTIEENLNILGNTVRELQITVESVHSDGRRWHEEAVERSRAAYRRAEELGYSVDDLRRKVRG